MRAALILSALLAAPLPAAPPPQFDAARLSEDIRILSSDAFEGRGPATPAEARTIDYIVARMKAAGLAPGGDPVPGGGRAWTQAVPLLRAAHAAPPLVSLALPDGTVTLRQGEEIAVRAPLTGAGTVRLDRAPLLFVGYGVTAPEKRWDDFKGQDVRGKILVMLVNDPDFESGQGDFGGKAMTYYGRWTYKYAEAARRGAAGVLLVHEDKPAAYGWATVRNSNVNPQFDIIRPDPAAAHTGLESWIARDVAVRLFRSSGLDFAAAKQAAQRRDFQPMPLKGTLSATVTADVGRIVTHNIAGRLAGRGHPGETLLYTAHWDHLGIGPPDATGDRIYNGAVDNASGVAELLALAQAFGRGARPDRSILFLSVGAEEKGLLGSEYYASHPLYPLATTVAAINMDGANVVGPTRDVSIAGSARLELLDDLVAAARAQGRRFSPEPHPEAGSFYRSDHFPLAKAGVPAISFKSGDDLVDGGVARGEALAEDYTRNRYHQPGDEWRADWNLAGAVQDLQLLHALGLRLADSREWPAWSTDAEFRAIRDRSAAERR